MPKRTSRIRSITIAAFVAAFAILSTVVTVLADGGGAPIPK